ncbi:2,3-bisphosphoglycerate-independent phosphoglycerate mutase [Aestuariicella hydrocarbonica]|uniref:2,3-bisphosphoglycerate-independent phosphoglycerate mutase n=1 Tax=Pseudomaricurvus hydrocarbonicus TaxID=1470433 RepID=A0A9E5T448_9GAMM|nr:2,3-bisphosphoglycerate-independent phosphoglycerate mutase [Aestuariicella hydrocarbonica]NHO67564.1 2,3-bisphosphoglycerate-independent phosphoglycerate mutase [Aestuariicella hydrocarbonica]
MTDAKKPLVLLVLDGFGYSESPKYNAIQAAKSPVWDRVWSERPHTLIGTSGMAVGLPEGQMGNSEVGHMTLGAGRVVYQNFTRINKAISDGDFFTNPVYVDAIDKASRHGKAVHILGLLSPGGVHSHDEHIKAAVELAAQRGAKEVYVHAFLDGRDVPPRSAEQPLTETEDKLRTLGVGRVASIIGRFYALDRDNRWERVQQAYDLLTAGKADYQAATPVEGLMAAYDRDENDEFVKATVIAAEGESPATINDGDAVLFMNFRPDRAREITRAFVDADFDGFPRSQHPALAAYVQTTEYAADIDAPIAFPPANLVNSFGDVMAKAGKQQLRIAETEKYAHVTFFFSGGQEETFPGEDRILIPSPNVETYDQQPEMSAPEVTKKLVEAIESGKYDAIICNYANCDQVGHTGDFDAAVKAVEAVDACLAEVFAALEKVGGEALVTADHGNVEQMFDDNSGQKHTQHTTLPVPFVYVGPRQLDLKSGGSLADVAPTMLALLGVEQPAEMTGQNLVELA